MIDTFLSLLANQYEAALVTLKNCIKSCPDDAWNDPVCNHAFSQSAFHALFWTDLPPQKFTSTTSGTSSTTQLF